VEGEHPLPLRLAPSSSEVEEEDSLLGRLGVSFFDFFFLGFLLDLDDCNDACFALVGVDLVLVLADPLSSCVVTPSALLESVVAKATTPLLPANAAWAFTLVPAFFVSFGAMSI
jgi:hypothetical protein